MSLYQAVSAVLSHKQRSSRTFNVSSPRPDPRNENRPPATRPDPTPNRTPLPSQQPFRQTCRTPKRENVPGPATRSNTTTAPEANPTGHRDEPRVGKRGAHGRDTPARPGKRDGVLGREYAVKSGERDACWITAGQSQRLAVRASRRGACRGFRGGVRFGCRGGGRHEGRYGFRFETRAGFRGGGRCGVCKEAVENV